MKQIIPLAVAALVGVGAYFLFVADRGTDAVVSSDIDVAQPVIDKADGEADYDTSSIREMSIGNPDAPCLLYTSPSPRDKRQSRMPSSA